MTLNLDLGAAEAKVARAVEHFNIFQTEMMSYVRKTSSYRCEFTNVDPHTGWCEAFWSHCKTEKPIFGVMLGDVIHNLRCALDYVVSELAKASYVTLTTRHQFPIFRSKQLYESTVGKIGSSLRNEIGQSGCVQFNVGCTCVSSAGNAYLDQYLDQYQNYSSGFEVWIPAGYSFGSTAATEYANQTIRVSGAIASYEGAPQIEVTDPSQIVLAGS